MTSFCEVIISGSIDFYSLNKDKGIIIIVTERDKDIHTNTCNSRMYFEDKDCQNWTEDPFLLVPFYPLLLVKDTHVDIERYDKMKKNTSCWCLHMKCMELKWSRSLNIGPNADSSYLLFIAVLKRELFLSDSQDFLLFCQEKSWWWCKSID